MERWGCVCAVSWQQGATNASDPPALGGTLLLLLLLVCHPVCQAVLVPDAASAARWGALDDVVMVSHSQLLLQDT
jgi:hypothetical protein